MMDSIDRERITLNIIRREQELIAKLTKWSIIKLHQRKERKNSMLSIDIPTEGKEITTTYSRLSKHDKLNIEMANFHLQIGDMQVCIDFKGWDEMIKFCADHNFTYEDKRRLGDY